MRKGELSVKYRKSYQLSKAGNLTCFDMSPTNLNKYTRGLKQGV